MLLLALDTSTSAVTVALRDDTGVCAASSHVDARAHAEHLAPGIRAVLRQAGRQPHEVTHVVTGTGPGPFTGLRVGIVTAATFAELLGIHSRGICSLDALAAQAFAAARACGNPVQTDLLVATDARRKEVYWARYRAQPHGVQRLDDPQVTRPDDLPAEVVALPCAGRGPLLYPQVFTTACGPIDVSAGALADLAAARLDAGDPLEDPTPRYLRRPDATPPAAPKSVSLPGRASGR